MKTNKLRSVGLNKPIWGTKLRPIYILYEYMDPTPQTLNPEPKARVHGPFVYGGQKVEE